VIARAIDHMSPWPTAAWLLGSRVRIPLGHGCLSLVFICFVVSCVGRGICDGLITRPEESYRLSHCLCVIKKPQKEDAKARFVL
jgi:hypothetical protein